MIRLKTKTMSKKMIRS